MNHAAAILLLGLAMAACSSDAVEQQATPSTTPPSATAAAPSSSGATSTSPGEPLAEPTPNGGVTAVPGAARPDGAAPPFTQVRWRDYGGASVPGTAAGPSTVTATGASGWALRGGASLAAAHYAVVADGAQPEAVWTDSVATAIPANRRGAALSALTAQAATVAADREKAHAGEEVHDGPAEPAWAPNVRVVGYQGVYRGEVATLTVWARPDGQDGAWWRRTVVVRWSGGDWRLVLTPAPTAWAMSDEVPSDLSAFSSTPATTTQEAP